MLCLRLPMRLKAIFSRDSKTALSSRMILNTVLRQASFTSAMIAQFTADYGPNAVNDDGNLPFYEANFVAALHDLFVGIPDVLDLGTANTIIVNPEPPAASYAVPMELIIKVLFTNILVGGGTGATTINVSGLGPRPLIIPDGSQLLPGDIIAGGKILVSYEATSNSFMLLSQRGTAATPQADHSFRYRLVADGQSGCFHNRLNGRGLPKSDVFRR